MVHGRIEEVLCWLGSATGLGSVALNAALTDERMQFFVFVVMAISCIATLIWALRVGDKINSKPFIVEEAIYLVIACAGMVTRMGALGVG